jgi:hypothetical protein
VVEVDQEIAAVSTFRAGMGASALAAAAGRIGNMFVEELATVMGPLVGVRDHRRLGQMHSHVVLPLTTNPTHQETVLTLAFPGHA